MGLTIEFTDTLEVTECWCGINLAVPRNLLRQAHRKGTAIYCPLGHSFVFTDNEMQELKRKLEVARDRATRLTHRLDQEEASHASTKGQLTKAKKRITNGVCPHCHRSFVNVARHMKSEHADRIVPPGAP